MELQIVITDREINMVQFQEMFESPAWFFLGGFDIMSTDRFDLNTVRRAFAKIAMRAEWIRKRKEGGKHCAFKGGFLILMHKQEIFG